MAKDTRRSGFNAGLDRAIEIIKKERESNWIYVPREVREFSEEVEELLKKARLPDNEQ